VRHREWLGTTWRWTTITSNEELVGDGVPATEDVRFDERWLALVLPAKQTNAHDHPNGIRLIRHR
jgi:hypothetical protein